MTLERLLRKIDGLLCAYFGLSNEEINPKTVQMAENEFFVSTTLPFKRHLIKESWLEFTVFDIKKTSKKNKAKLGLAAGKAIAKNLVVSFDMPIIRD